jgi:nucleotide-binding universal stress UspA family protein
VTPTGGRDVVLGLDTSESATSALHWALDEARSRGTGVRIVSAFAGPRAYGSLSLTGNLPLPDLTVVRASCDLLLAEAVAAAAERAPDVPVETCAYEGDAVTMLLHESERAASLVLGSRGLGSFGSAVLGSTGSAVSARASCPVVVVRGGPVPRHDGQTVVAGVDGLDTSDAVLSYAFDHASRHRLPLHAVLCWYPDFSLMTAELEHERYAARAEIWLAEAVAGWGEKYPDVSVRASAQRQHTVAGLVEASQSQHLLVVASRGRHSFVGTLLGSVSQGVLHHARCPVAVVPA